YTFGFANDDALWTPGEESLPLTVAFLVDDGVAVAFTARIGAGLPANAGLIAGMVFADYDGDGVRDEGEEGVPGAVIELRHDQREMLARTVTAADGRYRFGGLVAGAYTVTLAPQPLLAPTGDPVLHVLLTTTADGVSRFEEADFGALWAPGDSLGGNAVADATVRADVDSRRNDNYGADPFLAVGTGREGPSSPDRIRGYVRFEVPVFFREISAAHLELTIAAFRDGVDQTYELSVHRVLPTEGRTPWIEGNGSEVTPAPPGVEWVDAAAGIAWTGAADGGDANNQTQPEFAADASASLTLVQADHAVGDVIRIDVTDLVRGWINGDYPNEGLVLRDTGPGGFRQLWFGARDGLLRGYQDDRVQPGPRLVFE
ncbi:DNRLRE domain-containing protein, partial [bacterium]|nr:DNRLRE domain-containing protein [bacterium]